MMLKVSNEYLDFNADIEVERQIKAFEEISKTAGDFSYEFELYLSSENVRKLSLPFPDNISKNVYHKIPSELTGDDGITIFRGFIRIQRIVSKIAFCSFFSGNNNWMGLLSGPLTDIDFSEFSVTQEIDDILASKGNTSGVTWPIVDNGSLITRSFPQMIEEDFVPGIYVHTVFKKIFQHHSIKLTGELFRDPIYKSITTHRNVKSTADIEANSVFANKTSTTLMPVELDFYKVNFDSTDYPFYNGADEPFDLSNSTFTAQHKMRIHIEISLTPAIIDSSYSVRVYIYINGAFTFVDVGLVVGGLYNDASVGGIVKLDRIITLEAGDTLEVYSQWQQSSGSTQNDIVSGTLKITPVFIYFVSGRSIVPQWSQQDYVSNILRLFNCITSYDSVTKTLTVNLFDKIKDHDPVDISEYIEEPETDYTEFISNYGKRNLFSYQEVEFDDMRNYNIQNFFKYAQGVINADNDFLEDSVEVLESDFASPIGYLHPVFQMSMERMDLVRLEAGESVSFTAVGDSAGQAVFSVDKDIFLEGEVVRVSGSTNAKYNGDYVVDFRAAGTIELENLSFDTDATGTITKVTHVYNESDDVYLLINIPDYQISKFSGNSSLLLGQVGPNVTSHSTAFFSLLNTGRQINDEFVQGLSFGPIENPFFYQRTLIDTYWKIFSNIVNDPVMIKTDGFLPMTVNDSLDFLRPTVVRTKETANLYYVNRQTGYKGSHRSCRLEMIKLP